MSDVPPFRPVPRPAVAHHAWDDAVDRLRELRRDPRIAVVALVLAALAAGAIWYRIGSSAGAPPSARASRSGPPPSGARANAVTTTAATQPAAEVVVDVAGAVLRPGVAHLPAGARVTDAIAAAGGARPDADLGRLNLAAKLIDGQHVAVSRIGAPSAPVAAAGTAGADAGAGAGAEPSADAPLDLNAATEAQLETLPGIGPTLAKAIVAERERSGGFRSVDDLRRVRGIGDSRFNQVAPLVRV